MSLKQDAGFTFHSSALWIIISGLYRVRSQPRAPRSLSLSLSLSLELSHLDRKVHLLQLPPAGGGEDGRKGGEGGRDADHFAASFYTRNHGKWGQIVWWRALWCIMGGGRRIRYQQGTDTTGVLHMVRNWKPPIIHGRHAPWNDSAGNRLRLSKITKKRECCFRISPKLHPIQANNNNNNRNLQNNNNNYYYYYYYYVTEFALIRHHLIAKIFLAFKAQCRYASLNDGDSFWEMRH